MKKLDLIQGTDEWLEARMKYCCASEAPVIMGVSKFMTRNQLLDAKKGWQKNPDSSFKKMLFQEGHEAEAAARELLELRACEEFPLVVGLTVVSGIEFLASFDGLGESGPWEHKLYNPTLAENIRNRKLEPLYYWQLEHQMLVCGEDEILFTASDGTEEKLAEMVYRSVPERRKELIAGWKQFLKDLENHELEARQEVIVAQEVAALPAIKYEVKGSLIISNIQECLPIIRERAALEISKKLETDQDFADKDALNKATKAARARLKSILEEVQGEFVSYSEFAQTAAEIDSILQKMQSSGEKQVAEQKEARKREIYTSGMQQINDCAAEWSEKIHPCGVRFLSQSADLNGAMKNKRTIDSLKAAVDQEVVKVKILMNELGEKIDKNMQQYRAIAKEHTTLFRDIIELATNNENEAFLAIVKSRIAEHQEAERKKAEELREKIRLEEEAKAKKLADEAIAAAARKAEEERLAAERKAEAERLAAVRKAEEEAKLKAAEELKMQREAQERVAEPVQQTEAKQPEVAPEEPTVGVAFKFMSPRAFHREATFGDEITAWIKEEGITKDASAKLWKIILKHNRE